MEILWQIIFQVRFYGSQAPRMSVHSILGGHMRRVVNLGRRFVFTMEGSGVGVSSAAEQGF